MGRALLERRSRVRFPAEAEKLELDFFLFLFQEFWRGNFSSPIVLNRRGKQYFFANWLEQARKNFLTNCSKQARKTKFPPQLVRIGEEKFPRQLFRIGDKKISSPIGRLGEEIYFSSLEYLLRRPFGEETWRENFSSPIPLARKFGSLARKLNPHNRHFFLQCFVSNLMESTGICNLNVGRVISI